MGRPRTCSCDECPKCKRRIYMKAWYQRTKRTYVNYEKRRAYDNARYHNNQEYKKRHNARMALAQQVRRGLQTKGPCALCGAGSTIGHHNDYDKPLEGTWLCASCHENIHNALPSQ
jgi:ribosomal protein S27AE